MGCNRYYYIDALNADGEAVRKRKYRREDSKIQTWWYDWKGILVSDATEIARIEALATTHARVDEGFEDLGDFMMKRNRASSVEDLPMDAHIIEVSWMPDGLSGELSFNLDKGLDGDSYIVLVSNSGDHPATLFLPRVADTIRMSSAEGEMQNAGSSYIMLYPKQVAYVEASYDSGKWTFTMHRATAKDLLQYSIPEADYLLIRFNWNHESGDGLDTAFTTSGMDIAALDGMVVGYGMNGNTSSVNAYLEWGGENTGSGKENVAIKLSALRGALGDNAEDPTVKGYATWFTSEGGGLVTMEMLAYKGGTLAKDGTVFHVEDGELVWSAETDALVKSLGGADDYANKYTLLFMAVISKDSTSTEVSSGGAVAEKEFILQTVNSFAGLNDTVGKIQAQMAQALCITLEDKPTSSTVSYMDGEETVAFTTGAFVRVYDSDTGSYGFWKLADLSGDTATWVKMSDTRWGDVSIETTYNKDFEFVNITGGTALHAINSEADNIKFVNSSGSSVRVLFNQSVDGACTLVSTLATSEFTLTAGASATFTRISSSQYRLTQLFGTTVFPDLANADREGEWALTVSASGQPVLMEIQEIRQWNESIVSEMTTDSLNEMYPDVPQGFAVVAKTIGKIYEKANQYDMWVATDCVDV